MLQYTSSQIMLSCTTEQKIAYIYSNNMICTLYQYLQAQIKQSIDLFLYL